MSDLFRKNLIGAVLACTTALAEDISRIYFGGKMDSVHEKFMKE